VSEGACVPVSATCGVLVARPPLMTLEAANDPLANLMSRKGEGMRDAFIREVARGMGYSGLQTGIPAVSSEPALGLPSQETATESRVPVREVPSSSSLGSSSSCVPGELVLEQGGGLDGVVQEMPRNLPDDHPRLNELPPLPDGWTPTPAPTGHQGLGTRDEVRGTRTREQTYGDGKMRDTSTAELWDQIALYKAGELTPVPVHFAPLPADADPNMIAVAKHMRLLFGLRLADSDDRPLPYATSLPVDEKVVRNKPIASRAIRKLVAAGVIDHVGELDRTNTKVYLPAQPTHGPDPFFESRIGQVINKMPDDHLVGMAELTAVSDAFHTTRNGASHGT
jgi:hypothetical protein